MTTRSLSLSALIAGTFLAGTLAGVADDSPHTKVPLAQVKEEVASKKAVLVDVREPAETEKGHVRGAVLLPLSRLLDWERDGLDDEARSTLSKVLPRGSVVYTHCAAGGRSVPGGEVLRKLGYDARPLKPGYKALIDAGFPAADPKPEKE